METNSANFQRDVLVASTEVPIVLDLWAPWCAPCRMLGPILEKLEKEAAGAWRLVKLNTDESPEVAHALQVQGIPDVRLIIEGRVVSGFTGVRPEADIKRWLSENIQAPPKPGEDLLMAAKAARAEGNEGAALRLLQQAMQVTPSDEVRLALAELILVAQPEDAQALVADLEDAELAKGPRVEAIQTFLGLRQYLGGEGPSEAGWDSYRQGIEEFWSGQPEKAADTWLQTVQRHRAVDDDGARKALLALFAWWGTDSENAQAYRSRLASAMF